MWEETYGSTKEEATRLKDTIYVNLKKAFEKNISDVYIASVWVEQHPCYSKKYRVSGFVQYKSHNKTIEDFGKIALQDPSNIGTCNKMKKELHRKGDCYFPVKCRKAWTRWTLEADKKLLPTCLHINHVSGKTSDYISFPLKKDGSRMKERTTGCTLKYDTKRQEYNSIGEKGSPCPFDDEPVFSTDMTEYGGPLGLTRDVFEADGWTQNLYDLMSKQNKEIATLADVCTSLSLCSYADRKKALTETLKGMKFAVTIEDGAGGLSASQKISIAPSTDRRRLPALPAIQEPLRAEPLPDTPWVVIIVTILCVVNILFVAFAIYFFLRYNADKQKQRKSDLRARDSTWSAVVDRLL